MTTACRTEHIPVRSGCPQRRRSSFKGTIALPNCESIRNVEFFVSVLGKVDLQMDGYAALPAPPTRFPSRAAVLRQI
jgi:hypothetical protein